MNKTPLIKLSNLKEEVKEEVTVAVVVEAIKEEVLIINVMLLLKSLVETSE